MMEVIVSLTLLGLTFGMMFVITLVGTSPSQSGVCTNSDVCAICEENLCTTEVHGCRVCDTCNTELFATL